MTNIPVTDFVAVLLIFLRILGVLIAAPIFGSNSVPVIIRILLSAFIAYIAFLSLDTSSFPIEVEFLPLAIYGVKEIITGLIIGFALNMVFYAISYAGLLIGFDMGLSMAIVFNPGQETEENIIGQTLNILAIFVFFIINGHHYLISATVASFKVIPIGKFVINEPTYHLLLKYTGAVFILAVKIASPIMISYFLIVLAEGVLARVIPQMQIFFVAQPLVTGIGYLLLIVVLPIYVYFLKNLLKSYETSLYNLIKAMGA